MTARIIFNGQEYPSMEAMPDDVRRAYQQALAQLADADHNGIPDVLEGRGEGKSTVIGIQNSAITVNGKSYGSVGELPGFARFLLEQATNQLNRGGASAASDSPSAADDGLMEVLDQSENILSTILVVILAAAAGAVIVFGSWIITHMDESSRSQGGVFYVGLAVVVVLGLIAGQFVNLWWRRQK